MCSTCLVASCAYMQDACYNRIQFQTVESAFIPFQLGEKTRFEVVMIM